MAEEFEQEGFPNVEQVIKPQVTEAMNRSISARKKRQENAAKRSENNSWMTRFQKRRKNANIKQKITDSISFVTKPFTNLSVFNNVITQLLSLFSICILAYSMYLVVEHLRSGNWLPVLAGTAFMIAVSWLNSQIGVPDGDEQEELE